MHVQRKGELYTMVHYIFATEEQKEFAETAYTIVSKELGPKIEEYENADGGLGCYPKEVHDMLVESGFYGVTIPEEMGGLGLDPVTQAIILEKIGEVDAGFAFALASAESQWPNILKTSMPDEEKQEWIDKILAGAIGSFALTESNAGSDPAAMTTHAEFDEKTNEWIINGRKCFCSGGPNADFYVVMAWTDKTQRPSKGITAFFVEKERGVEVAKKENKMGLHLSETADIVFDDVRVPADHVIGHVNAGFGEALGTLGATSAICNCCPVLGSAQAALDYATDYAKERRQFGKRIIDHQAVGFMIADMNMKISAARCMLYEYLCAARDGVDDQKLGLMIKCFVTDTANEVIDMALQVLGGYGYMKEYPLDRHRRNARIFQIFGGTNQIKRKNLAKAIAGRDPQARR